MQFRRPVVARWLMEHLPTQPLKRLVWSAVRRRVFDFEALTLLRAVLREALLCAWVGPLCTVSVRFTLRFFGILLKPRINGGVNAYTVFVNVVFGSVRLRIFFTPVFQPQSQILAEV
mgnify:CR=1 FL=1